ncbi:energy-coupling factor transporter ATPase [Natroniella sp. ANB-PHB2]|uniref:energy-coupling factor transporter ATPase n=1 Tax=Natroniella sp. ANB-PHB2 TaxID=3384444 RepID=UPI0038D470BB
MLLEVKELSHNYDSDSSVDNYSLKDINFTIERGEFLGLIGHTGSGKSTLVQTLNGLIKPTTGQIIIDDQDITKIKNLKEVRRRVGLVFQYPEHQLFEETVFADIAFGPRNLGLTEQKVEQQVKNALEIVSLDYQFFKDRSPFKLSGGQQRRVAIAGVLAMEPEILILDEPTAGLDPKTRQEIIAEIVALQQRTSLTIILISHRMEEIARLADRILVLDEGELVLNGTSEEVFQQQGFLENIGLGVPQITEVLMKLKNKGNKIATDIFTIEEAEQEILKLMRG